jgi:hypothetical protein
LGPACKSGASGPPRKKLLGILGLPQGRIKRLGA